MGTEELLGILGMRCNTITHWPLATSHWHPLTHRHLLNFESLAALTSASAHAQAHPSRPSLFDFQCSALPAS